MRRPAMLAVTLVSVLGACSESPVSPGFGASSVEPLMQHQRPNRGTGIALESVTGVFPLIGDVQVTQIVITEFSTFLGGLQASGTITGLRAAVGGGVVEVTEDFTTDVVVASNGPGNCSLVTVDLQPISADVFDVVNVDIPLTNVGVEGSGAVGTLLCTLGSVVNGATGVVRGLVNALNGLIGGGQAPTPVPPRGPRA